MKNSTKLFLVYFISLSFCISCKSNEKVFIAPSDSKKGLLKSNGRACYFDDVDNIKKKIEIELESADQRELEIVENILYYAGLPQNFKIYRGNIDNAMATMVDNQRLIIYNKELFTIIDKLSDSYWASIFILAHEIGHHLAYNISDENNPIAAELDADGFATSILYRMGADSKQVQVAINSSFISNETDTKTHPAKSKRIDKISSTWKKAAEQSYTSAVPPDPGIPDSDEELGISKIDEVYDAALYIPGCKGIILNVQPLKRDSSTFLIGADIGLKMSVLVTEITDKEEQMIKKNGRHIMEVYYTNRYVGSGEEPFLDFFKPGRRMNFDVARICEDTECDHIITAAHLTNL